MSPFSVGSGILKGDLSGKKQNEIQNTFYTSHGTSVGSYGIDLHRAGAAEPSKHPVTPAEI